MEDHEFPHGFTGTVALASFLLGTPRGEWVHRRIETLEVLDEGSLLRRVSIDFTVPALPRPLAALGSAVAYVPIAYLEKDAQLKGFDLRSADGSALPLMTLSQSGAIATEIVKELERLRPSHSDIEFALELLKQLIPDDEDRATDLLERRGRAMAASAGADLDAIDIEVLEWYGEVADAQPDLMPFEPVTEAQRSWLRLRPLAADLAHNVVLYARVDATPGARQVVKYCYEEPLEPRQIDWRGMLGLRGVEFEIPASGIGDAREYHLQIPAPAELLIATARLDDATGTPLDEDPDPGDRTHLVAVDQPATTRGTAYLSFSLRSAGSLLTPSLAIVAILAVTLLLGAVFRSEFGSEIESVTTLLVLVPGLSATYLASAGEHRLVHKLVSGLRRLLLLAALLSFVATLSLVVFKNESCVRMWVWLVLFAVASGITMVFAAAFLRSRRLERSSVVRPPVDPATR